MALSKDRVGHIHENLTAQKSVPVAANTRIFVGATVSYDANGFCVPAADTATQAGKAIHYAIIGADNSAGANGDKEVMVMTRGTALVDKGAIVQGDLGKLAHAIADDTVALTSTNERPIGPILAVGNRLVAIQIG